MITYDNQVNFYPYHQVVPCYVCGDLNRSKGALCADCHKKLGLGYQMIKFVGTEAKLWDMKSLTLGVYDYPLFEAVTTFYNKEDLEYLYPWVKWTDKFLDDVIPATAVAVHYATLAGQLKKTSQFFTPEKRKIMEEIREAAQLPKGVVVRIKQTREEVIPEEIHVVNEMVSMLFG